MRSLAPRLLLCLSLFLAGGTALSANTALPLRVEERPGAPFLVVRGLKLAELEGQGRTSAMQRLGQAIFARYGDRADFVVVIGNRRELPASVPLKGYHLRVKNEVQGIGVPKFDAGNRYGATGHFRGHLQGMLYFPHWFPYWQIPFVHEFAHGWGNDLLPTAEPGHFGFCGAGSQLGGFDSRTLKRVGPDTYQARNLLGLPFGTAANGSNSVPYSEFELYLMGLRPAQGVEPFSCAYAGSWVDRSRGIFRASRMHLLNMQEIVKKYGPRQPDFTRSPKTFRLLAILVSEQSPTPQQLNLVSLTLRHLTSVGDDGDSHYTFSEATRGLGRLELLEPRAVRR